MKDHEAYEQLRQARWRRRLTAREQAELSRVVGESREERETWREEEALSSFIERLPDVPVTSNFTARVLSQLQVESTPQPKALDWTDLLRRWIPRVAFGAAAVALCIVSYDQFQAQRQAAVWHNLSTVAELVSVPGPEVLGDFDAIRALERAPVADVELLRLLE